MGLLDGSLDPQTAGVLALAGGLLSPGSFGQGLSRGIAGQQAIMGNAQEMSIRQQQADRLKQQADMQALAERRAMQQEQAMAGLRSRYTQPDGTFDFKGYSQALGAVDPQGALAMQKLLVEKKPALMNVPAGGTVFDPEARTPLYTAPKEETPPEITKLINQRDKLPMGSPLRAVYDRAITKATTHAPGVSVSYGAPVAGVGADGKPVFFQPSKDGGPPTIVPGVSPTPPVTPASTREKMAENAVALQKLDAAIGLVDAHPDSLGLKNNLGDTIMQRVDPQGVDVRAAVADIGSQKIHDRSGAAVTVSEAPRLKPFVPQATDTAAAAKKKLVRLRAEMVLMQQALNTGASVGQAANAPLAPKKNIVVDF